MNSQRLDQILQHAAKLTLAERLLLAAHLIQGVRKEIPHHQSRRKWRDAVGLIKHPALGEDAQAYISRNRQSQDNHRSQIIRDGE